MTSTEVLNIRSYETSKHWRINSRNSIHSKTRTEAYEHNSNTIRTWNSRRLSRNTNNKHIRAIWYGEMNWHPSRQDPHQDGPDPKENLPMRNSSSIPHKLWHFTWTVFEHHCLRTNKESVLQKKVPVSVYIYIYIYSMFYTHKHSIKLCSNTSII